MRFNLQIGEKWGCVEVAGIESMGRNPEDRRMGGKICHLRCRCGEEFEITSYTWEGKRRTRDCGCGISEDPGNIPVIMSLYVPVRLRAALEQCARDNQVSKNRFVKDLLVNMLEGAGYEI